MLPRYDFTSKIRRMYDDIANSATQQEEYNKTVSDGFQGKKVVRDCISDCSQTVMSHETDEYP